MNTYYFLVVILLLLVILMILLLNYYFQIKKTSSIKSALLSIEFESFHYLDAANLDNHFEAKGGNSAVLNIKNTFSIENETLINLENLPFKVNTKESKMVSTERNIKPSTISKFLYLKNKLIKDKEIIVFDNRNLLDKLERFRDLQESANEFPLIQISTEQITAQRKLLKNNSSPALFIAGKLQDSMRKSFCFIEGTNFKVKYEAENSISLELPTKTEDELIFKVSLTKDFVTKNGDIFFREMKEKNTPLSVFGDVSIGEKNGAYTVIIIPTLIF